MMVIALFLLVPMILNIPELVIPSIIAAFLTAAMIWKRIGEKYFRSMHLIYILIIIYFILV